MKAFDYDDKKFVRRIKKYRECRLNKRVLQSKWAVVGKITIKIKTIGISSIEKKNKKSNVKDVAAEENNDGEIAETKDSILNLPAVVSAPTTDNIMKHTEVDEPAVRNGVVGGADVPEGDMKVLKGKTDKGKKENKAPDPREAKKADEDESKEDAKDAEDDGPDVSAKDPKDDGTDVSNNIRDKGGGGWWRMRLW